MAERDQVEEVEPVTTEMLNAYEQGAMEVVTEVCRVSGLDVQPEPRGRHTPYLDVELVGSDAGEAFGRHGQALDSLQYLVNLVVSRKVGPDVRLILDADGYRRRRAERLVALAQEYADLVRDRQEECELDPLPAHERRIIHTALKNESGIRTYSEGDDPERRVIIAPQ